MLNFALRRLALEPALSHLILVFFAYATLGYMMECVVVSLEKKHLVLNRGFVVHLPFCIIYGFGALGLFALLQPFAKNLVAVFLIGSFLATSFEYCVARLQMRLFGDFWWDYNNKPFNYKGVLCLESSIGWGIGSILLVRVLHHLVVRFTGFVPDRVAPLVAGGLIVAYLADFAYSTRAARSAALPELDPVAERRAEDTDALPRWTGHA